MIRRLALVSLPTLVLLAAIFGLAFSARERCEVQTDDAEAVFIVPSATAPVEYVVACETGDWSKHLAMVTELGAERVFSVPAFGADGRATGAHFSPWPTDDWVIGLRGSRRAVLLLPGQRNLDDWGPTFFDKQGWGRVEIGKPRDDSSLGRFDKGGNILATPSLPGFPHGRLIVGRSLRDDVKDFFRQQSVQAGPDGKLIEIDTDWLKVGHVDEILAFVRAPGRPGFRVVLPDFEAGLRLLASTPAEQAVFYGQGSAETAGSVTDAGARQAYRSYVNAALEKALTSSAILPGKTSTFNFRPSRTCTSTIP